MSSALGALIIPIVLLESFDGISVRIQTQDSATILASVFQNLEETFGESRFLLLLLTRSVGINRDEVAAVIGHDIASRNFGDIGFGFKESIVVLGDVYGGSVEILVDGH